MPAFLASLLSSVVTNVAADLITNAIMSLLGLNTDESQAAYEAAVTSKLDAIQDELQQVLAGVAAIEQGITEIKAEIVDSELQTALEIYTTNKNLITQNFETYSNAVQGLAQSDTKAQAIKQIYSLLRLQNMDALAQAMLNVSDELLGSGELRGILDYQIDVAHAAIASFPATLNNLQFISSASEQQPPFAVPDPNLGIPVVNLMNDNLPFYDGFAIVYRAIAMGSAEAITQQIIPTWSAALTVQLQGLMLLTIAWNNTIQANQLTQHVTNIQNQIAKMRLWWTTFADANALNAVVEPLIAEYAPTITDAARLTSPWYFGGTQVSSYPEQLKGWYCWSFEQQSMFGPSQQNCLIKPPVVFAGENTIWTCSYDATNGYVADEQRDLGLSNLMPGNFIPPQPTADLTAFLAGLPSA